MSYTQIRAHVIDQTVQLTNMPKLASGTENVVQIRFDFCSLWDGYGKIAVFYRDQGEVYHIVVAGNVATVPREVLADAGHFYFGVMGVGDNTRTTEVLRVNVTKGAPTKATAEPGDPIPDIYQQLLAAYGAAETALAIEIAARQAADATEKAERQAEIAVERARINQFTALPNGSTTGDAELMDIRIGVDGTNYASAGAAVRGQFREVNREIGEIASLGDFSSKNLFLLNKITTGGYYNASGEWVAENTYTSSEFIDIAKYDKLKCTMYVSAVPNAMAVLANFYDENRTVIHSERYNKTAGEDFIVNFTVPEGAVYFTINSVYNAQGGWEVIGYYENPILKAAKVFAAQKGLTGKKISILGDSISTYAGYIPATYEVYYSGNNCGVSSVDETWWKRVINITGMELCVNDSWSGATVSNVRDQWYPNSSGVDRCENLNTDDVSPDIIIVYMGTNDFRNLVSIGDYDGTQEFPTIASTFKNAYAIMLKKILTKYPSAMVYVCTLKQFENLGDAGFPDKNGVGLTINDYNKAILDMATLFGVPVIDFNKSGLNYFNLAEYCGDYNSNTGKGMHPNAAGHKKLADRAIFDLIGDLA